MMTHDEKFPYYTTFLGSDVQVDIATTREVNILASTYHTEESTFSYDMSFLDACYNKNTTQDTHLVVWIFEE